jgi:uncharacterized protein YecT (DUF1311 family)
MRRLAVPCFALLLTCLAHAARADCDNALSDFDVGVCAAQSFNDTSNELDMTYRQTFNILSPDQQTQLRHDELDWIAKRDSQCGFSRNGVYYVDFNCATNMTEARITALKNLMNGPGMFSLKSGEYLVRGTSPPWLFQQMGLNKSYMFGGWSNGMKPTIVKLAAVNAKPGQTLIITYISGRVSIGPGWPGADAAGTPNSNGFDDSQSPDEYVQSGTANPGALLGAFTDATGQLVAAPLAINDGPFTAAIPPGAVQLQLGINDYDFGDNTGGMIVNVKRGGS